MACDNFLIFYFVFEEKHEVVVSRVLYGREKFYGCEKPILIGKIKKFSLIKLVCMVFFLIVILLKLNRLLWILILIELHIRNKEHV